MNILAHIYLSGSSEEIQIGNFIGDYVKGNRHQLYPEPVKKGIIIHRNIDAFTDVHPIVKESKKPFQKVYHKYAGVLIDIIYDHFLSKEWDSFSDKPLDQYIYSFHKVLQRNTVELPKKVKEFLPSFIGNNWLKLYQTIDGVETVFNGMSNKTSLPNNTKFAIKVFTEHYEKFRKDFLTFFPQIIRFIEAKHEIDIFSRHLSNAFLPINFSIKRTNRQKLENN